MGTILNEIKCSQLSNKSVIEMIEYLNSIVQSFPNVVIIERPKGGIIVVPAKAYEQSVARDKNIFTYWDKKNYIVLDIRYNGSELIANNTEKKKNCIFYNLTELKDRSIDDLIINNCKRISKKFL